MITGDNAFTALEVARELQLATQIGEVIENDLTDKNISNYKIFARMSPQQKQEILNQLNKKYFTIMCGDGTNDVAALKSAHIGIALVQSLNQDQNHACIAAPFCTNQLLSVEYVIKQGRCALATTFQMYKILAINCLLSAFSLSVLYYWGVKFGDTQATLSGFGVAFQLLFVSKSKPLKKLQLFQPPSNIFSFPVIASVLFQFIFQLLGLLYLIQLLQPIINELKEEERVKLLDPDADFTPNILNTVIFLYGFWMQTLNILINYQVSIQYRENHGWKAFS